MLNILVPDFRVIAPELILVGTTFAIILWEMITRTRRHVGSVLLATVGTIIALAVTAGLSQLNISTFGDSVVLDPFASFFKMIFLLGLLLTIAISSRYIDEGEVREHAEYYALLILAVVGMMVLATGRELVTLFLGLELMSMSLYILAGIFKTDPRSNEASMKYFILGSFATGFMLFGMSYIYGMTGSTHLRVIGRVISENPGLLANKGLLLGLFMLLVGFAFKISAVPFHQWTPDVYEGAPTSVTAFMAAGPKAAAFAALIRVLMEALPQMKGDWELLFTILAVVTMTLANLVALSQDSVKRMLAYSSIAHVGYILIGFVASVGGHADRAFSAVMFYLLAYTFMNTGAFAILIFLTSRGFHAGHPWAPWQCSFFCSHWRGFPPRQVSQPSCLYSTLPSRGSTIFWSSSASLTARSPRIIISGSSSTCT